MHRHEILPVQGPFCVLYFCKSNAFGLPLRHRQVSTTLAGGCPFAPGRRRDRSVCSLSRRRQPLARSLRQCSAYSRKSFGHTVKHLHTKRDRRTMCSSLFACICMCMPNYEAEIAPVGHAASQVPHSRHASASISNLPSPSWIASAGHSSAHVPQATHSSPITYAMFITSFLNCKLLTRNSPVRILIRIRL